MTPFARLPKLSFNAKAIANATAEKPAMIPAVENPYDVINTISRITYKTTVTTEIINEAAELSNLLLFKEALRVVACTIFIITSPKTRKAIVRTIASPVF